MSDKGQSLEEEMVNNKTVISGAIKTGDLGLAAHAIQE